jgi:hypothetical protein
LSSLTVGQWPIPRLAATWVDQWRLPLKVVLVPHGHRTVSRLLTSPLNITWRALWHSPTHCGFALFLVRQCSCCWTFHLFCLVCRTLAASSSRCFPSFFADNTKGLPEALRHPVGVSLWCVLPQNAAAAQFLTGGVFCDW